MLILCDFNRLKLNFKPPKKPWTLKLSKVVMFAIMNGRWNWQNLKNCEVQKKSDLIWTQSRKKSQFKSLQSLFKRTNNTQKMPAALVALYFHATIHATHQHFCSANHWAPQHSPSPRELSSRSQKCQVTQIWEETSTSLVDQPAILWYFDSISVWSGCIAHTPLWCFIQVYGNLRFTTNS